MAPVDVVGDYIIKASQSLTLTNTWGFALQQPEVDVIPRLINSGTVTVNQNLAGENAIGAYTKYGGDDDKSVFWNRAHGDWTVAADGEVFGATGAFLVFWENKFINDGKFTVSSIGDAKGVEDSGHASFINTGHFEVRGINSGTGVEGGALKFFNSGEMIISGDYATGCGQDSDEISRITNRGLLEVDGQSSALGIQNGAASFDNSGVILVTAIDYAVGMIVRSAMRDFHNSGEIRVSSSATGASSVGLDVISSQDTSVHVLTNSGLISAEVAIDETDSFGSVGMAIDLENSGRIVGDISLGGGADRILNTGRIQGEIDLGEDDDIYDGRHGKLLGSIAGGEGNDILIGGKNAETLLGDSGAVQGHGADRLVGGGGSDTLTGGGGDDTFIFWKLKDSTVAHADLITSLSTSDIIDVSRIDADTTHAGNQAFRLVAALDGHAGEATLNYDAGSRLTHLELDVDGDGHADSLITIKGDQTAFTNFVL
jgi:hypothetical protein